MDKTGVDETLLALENWSLGYDAPNIIEKVNLRIKRGQCIALVGHNGVGKSSLLRSIMGFLPHTQGRLYFDGRDVSHYQTPQMVRLGLGLVMQENNVFSKLRVDEHFAIFNNIPLEENLCYFPDLLSNAKKTARQLSGGQRQQLAIALALAQRPSMLLLDEPSANIQPSVVETMLNMLKQVMATTTLTVMIAEQNLAVIRHLASHVYCLYAGRLVNECITVAGKDKSQFAAALAALTRSAEKQYHQ